MREVEHQPVVIVDVRSVESYQAKHAEDALSIPLAELETRAPHELSRDTMIVTYCT